MKTYCAFCRSERKIQDRRRAGLFHFFFSLLASMLLMYLIWQNFDPRAGVFFILFLVLSDVFVQARWRISVICQTCGFDPVLYSKNQHLAAQNVKEYLAVKKLKPENFLRKPLNLPVLKPGNKNEKTKALQPKSSLLSRQV